MRVFKILDISPWFFKYITRISTTYININYNQDHTLSGYHKLMQFDQDYTLSGYPKLTQLAHQWPLDASLNF
jgi:hypothetical protein